MNLSKGILTVSIESDLDDVKELKAFVGEKINEIKEIKVTEVEKPFATSSLFQLLFSIKKTKPSIRIPILDHPLILQRYGKLHWVNND